MPRFLVVLAVLVAVGMGACAVWPERWAFNAPMGNALFGWEETPPAAGVVQARIQVPEGFSISPYARGLRRARALRFTPSGDLLVSQPRHGRVTLLARDDDGDGAPDGRRTLLSDLNRPFGMDFHEGWLYVAETDAVGRIRYDPEARSVSGEFERVVTGLPGGGNHWTRSLRFGPDGWLYVSIGSSCNVCEETDERRASLMRFRPDGSEGEIYATGLRNTVGFDWRPQSGELFGTDNGRDMLGDDFPPCELNRIEQGGFYGWPYANGAKVADPDLGEGNSERIAASLAPAHAFGAHTAPLGLTFLRGSHWPVGYRGAGLTALHGSWNRTKKSGYKVVSLHFGGRGTVTERDFVWGFEEDENVIGRPVDVAEGPDGAIYISDDFTGSIYRVTHGEGAAGGLPMELASGLPAATNPFAGMDEEERKQRADRGGALYEHYFCAQCHEGIRAKEGVVVVPLAGLTARYGVDDMVRFMAAPTPPMPALELSDEERRDLSVWLLSTYP
jgi:glucose/arabinose dehydrogenase